ncbi:hypothetical protein BH23ACT9_BH23ACT9_00560 [soil metagenome]
MTSPLDQTTDRLLTRYDHTVLLTVRLPSPGVAADHGDRQRIHLGAVAEQVADVLDDDAAQRVTAALEAAGPDLQHALVAVVTDDDVHIERTTLTVDEPVVTAGPLPDLVDLLQSHQTWVPHALVIIDRIGADVTIVTSDAGIQSETTVDSEDLHVTRSQPGGWSQRRFQQRAEEAWRENVDAVIDEVGTDLRRVGLVLVSGDVHAVQLFREALGGDIELVDLDAGSRAEDGSDDALAAAADAAVIEVAARRRSERVGQVLGALGAGVGVTGRQDVLAALFEHRIDTLVIDPAVADDISAWFGPGDAQVAADSSILHALDLDARQAPLTAVAIRGAATTGASVIVAHAGELGAEVTDGVVGSTRH